jgi:uncharacterized protein
MTVIDCHTHLSIDAEDLEPWMPYLRRCGVERIIALGAVLAHGYNPTADQVREINDHTARLMARYPGFCGGLCFLNPTLDPRESIDELERCRAAGFIGAKLEVSAFASDPRLDPIMRRLAEVRLPLLHHCWNTWCMGRMTAPGCHQTDPDDLAELAARHPRVTIVSAHLKAIGVRGVRALSEYPNVVFDTSGALPVAGVIEEAVRLAGADRVLFGSDAMFPLGRDVAVQKACIEAARISDRAKERILGLNTLRVFGEGW